MIKGAFKSIMVYLDSLPTGINLMQTKWTKPCQIIETQMTVTLISKKKLPQLFTNMRP